MAIAFNRQVFLILALFAAVNSAQHDARGNLVRSERGYGFTYDFENRLTRVFTDTDLDGQYDVGEPVHAEYVVDALGRRAAATVSGQTTYRYYDGPVALAEFAAGNPATPVVCYLNGPGYLDEKLLIRSGPGGSAEVYVLHKDLYTVSGVVSRDGQLVEWYTYDGYGRPTTHAVTGPSCNGCGHAPTCPGDVDGDGVIGIGDLAAILGAFGTTLGDPGYDGCADFDCDDAVGIGGLAAVLGGFGDPCPTPGNPFRFTGQRLDVLDGGALLLYDFKARVYDPRHGRFLQRDPAEFADAYNLYEYAASRVTTLTDPTGEFSLGSLLTGTTISRGFAALNAAQAAQTALNAAKRLAAGASLQGVLISLTIEYATDKFGGKVFDQLTSALNLLKGKFSSGVFRGRLGGPAHRAAVEAAEGDLKKNGFEVLHEGFLKNTEGGQNRFADLVGYNKATGELQLIQVGDINQLTGLPVGRELDALNDILFNSETGGQFKKFLENQGIANATDITSISIRFIEKVSK